MTKFLARRGFVFRQATPWHRAHFRWLHALVAETGDRALASEDVVVLGEYLALLEYTLGRRDAVDEQIEALALTPAYAAPVGRLKCYRAIDTLSAVVLITELGDWRRFTSPAQLAYWGPGADGTLPWPPRTTRVDHQGGQQSLSPHSCPSRLALSTPAIDLWRAQRGNAANPPP